MKYSAVIVDDEEYARGIVGALLEKISSIELVASCANGHEAIKAITELRPDIVFLDIQMPEINGFEVIQQTQQQHHPQFIFVTAYDEFALKAFEVNAIDYLLKPFDDVRFFQAVQRAQDNLSHQKQQLDQIEALMEMVQSKTSSRYLERVGVKVGVRTLFVPTDSIIWVEADNQYVKIHAKDGTHVHRESLTKLEEKLNPEHFARVHRSAIVNLSQIRSVEPHFGGDSILILLNGVKVKLAKSRKGMLRKRLGW